MDEKPKGRRWDDEVDESGLPISPGAKAAVDRLDKQWGERYTRLAKRLTRMVAIIAVACLGSIALQGIFIGINDSDSGRQDTAIINAQKTNCAGFNRLRDGFEIVLLRAYAALDPPAAKALAVKFGLPPKVLPDKPSLQARNTSEEQKRIARNFYVLSITELDKLTCRPSKKVG